jgi:hypothetical protein
MPKVSRQTAARSGTYGVVENHADELDSYTVNFVSFAADIDATPLLEGLPDDRCQCPHWGYVLSGAITMQFADREEIYEAGDAFYAPPGHAPIRHAPGTEIVQFSPTEDLRRTEEVMARNMEAMHAN